MSAKRPQYLPVSRSLEAPKKLIPSLWGPSKPKPSSVPKVTNLAEGSQQHVPVAQIFEEDEVENQPESMDIASLVDTGDQEYVPAPKRAATAARMQALAMPNNLGFVPRENFASSSSQPNKTQVRREAAKTQHTTGPRDDMTKLCDQLSDNEEDDVVVVKHAANVSVKLTPPAAAPLQDPEQQDFALTEQPNHQNRKRKRDEREETSIEMSPPATAMELTPTAADLQKLVDRHEKKKEWDRKRKRAQRQAAMILKQRTRQEQAVAQLDAILEQGKESWLSPMLDPQRELFREAITKCLFTVENGFDMSQSRIDLVFPFRKPQHVTSQEVFDNWCGLVNVYVSEMMATPVTKVERDSVAKGNSHPEHSSHVRSHLETPWFILLRFSANDPELAKPVKTLWDLVRPARMYGVLRFLQEYYSMPDREAKTFKSKLGQLKHLLDWLGSKPVLKLSQDQIQEGVMEGLAGAVHVPPEPGTNKAILESFACRTSREANQAAFWISSAIEETKKLQSYATDTALANPRARTNENGLRKAGDWPTRELFRKTLAEIQRRLEVYKHKYFEFVEGRWTRKQALKDLSEAEQRKVFFGYQEYLIAVSVIAAHGSRRQVPIHMRVDNIDYKPEGDDGETGMATLEVDFKEKVQSRKDNTLLLAEKYFSWFYLYHQAILPRVAMPKDSTVYWRRAKDGIVMSPSSFTAIHQKIWYKVGVDVQNGDKTGVPKSFQPGQVRRWVITEFFHKDDMTEAQLTEYASVMNTSVEMMRKYYNRQMSELRQIQVTRTIAEMLEAEQCEAERESDNEVEEEASNPDEMEVDDE